MADIYKNSRQAGAEVRGIGQGNDYEPGAIYKGLTGRDYTPGDVYRNGPPGRTGIAAPTAAAAPIDSGQYDALNASIAGQANVVEPPPPVEEPGIVDSAAKGFKSVMVTWDFLANKLETAITGDGSTTAPILQQSVDEYKAMASDPRIAEMVQLGNEAPGYYEAGKAMLGYAVRNPGLIANFLAEQGAAVVASLPVGGVGGGLAAAAVGRTALSQGVKAATTMGATGASINASAVVLGSLGTNYVEGLDKFKGDKEAAADYASTKTLAEVPANAVAGMFLGVNPFSRVASPTASAVGNVGFQTAVQGAGGGVGAIQAAESVGEEAGKGEVLAEIFGEGLLAPIDLASARRDASKRGVTPPGASVTVEPAPAEFDNAQPIQQTSPGIVQDQDFSRLSAEEFQSAIESPAFMAALYSRGDEATRARLQAANPNLNLPELVQDGNLVMDGLNMADNGTGPEFVSMFNQALAESAPPAPAPFEGGTRVDTAPQDFIPPREKLRLAQNLAEEGQMLAAGETITREQAEAIRNEKVAPSTSTGEENTPVASQPSPLAQLTQVEQQIQQPRFGLPSTINVADTSYVVEVGPTKKKRKDESPVNAFVSSKGKVIKIDGQAIVDSFDEKPWTKPKVEEVKPLPEDTFASSDQWLDFVFKHETAHISNKKQPGESTGAYENRINQIALTEIKGKEYADAIYAPEPVVEAAAEVAPEPAPTPEIKPVPKPEPKSEVKAEVKPEPKPKAKPKTKKRVQFQEIANETPAPQVQEAAPVAERTQGEPSQPEPQERPVQAIVPKNDQASQAPAQTVSDEVPPLVGPTRDRLYFEGAEKLELTEKILDKYPYNMRQKMIARIRPMPIEGVRKLWSKVSRQPDVRPPKREQEANQFDDDTGGVMSNMARSGAMGLDAIAELGNKERAEAARRAQLEEEVRQSTLAMNRRAEAAAQTITDPELRALADSQQREIGGTTVDGFINPEGDFAAADEITRAEMDSVMVDIDQDVLALQYAEAVNSGEMTALEAKRRARDDGVGTYSFINAMRTYGVDPTQTEIKQSGAIAANFTLRSYVRDSGLNGYQARELWLKSYDNLKDKAAVELTRVEQAAYDNWKSNRVKYQARLSEAVKENASYQVGTLEDVFPNVLFNQFTLSEMRNPSSIPEPLRSVVTDLFADPAAAWFQDIATVLTIRPDFEAQVNEVLTQDEQSAYTEWRNSDLREAMRNAEMMVKSPAYSQLTQLRSLSPEMFADFQAKIRMAEQNQLAVILHEASEMNDLAEAAKKANTTPENAIDQQMREYTLRDEAQSVNLDDIEEGDGTALYKRGYRSGAVSALTIQEHLTNQFANWDTKPEYTVVENVTQLPMDVRLRLTERLEEGAFKGALDTKTGHIYLFSENMESASDAEFTMFHELYGHWGMRSFLGAKLDTFLDNQYKVNKEVRAAADRIRAEASEMGMPMGRLESVEEAISDLAAAGKTSLFDQIIGQLSAWLKKHGFPTVATWLDTSGKGELAYILKQAKAAARGQGQSPLNGAPTEIRYATSKIPVEMFATRDGKTTGYARQNPITGYWTVFGIKDSVADQASTQTVEDYGQALDFLKKVGDVVRAKDSPLRLNTDPKFVTVPDKRQMVNETKLQAARRLLRQAQIKVQNKYLPVFEWAEYLRSQGFQNDVINRLKLLEGKTKYYVDNFELKYQVPITQAIEAIGKKGGTVENIDLYLLARHAEERNKVVKNINPSNPFGSGMGPKSRTLENGDVIPGYRDVLRESESAPYAAELEAVGKLMDRLSKDKAAYMLAQGQISQSQYDAISQYEHYVTLSGNETELEFVDTEALGGRALNLRGSDAKRALGRGTLPVDVLQNTLNSYLSTVIRGQKNEVAQAVTQLAREANDPNFAVVEEINTVKKLNTERLIADKAILKVIGDAPTEVSGKQFMESLSFQVSDGQIDSDTAITQLRNRIREAEARRDIEPAQADAAIKRLNEEAIIAGRLSPSGYVVDVEQDISNQPNVLVAKFDGKPVKTVFKDKGMEFIDSLSGMSDRSRSSTAEAIGAWTRFFSQLVTSWNPAWILINGIRDFQTVLTNMANDPRVGIPLANEMRKAWTRSFVTSFQMQVANQGIKSNGYWGKFLKTMSKRHPLSADEAMYFEEFRKEGAETFFLDRKKTEFTIERMNRHLNPKNGPISWTVDTASALGEFIELLSLPMETAPRFAVYKTLRKNGMSPQDAAVYAKEVSVNFNMQGSSAWIRSLYVFANPTIQGNVRLYQDYSRSKTGVGRFLPSNRFTAVMGGWFMLGVLGNFIARGIGGEDDELPGVDKLDQIPHHKRSTSFIIAPGVPGAAIPVGYGINLFYTMGHYATDVWTGKMEADKAAIRIAKTAFDSFSPIGSGVDSATASGSAAKTLVPTVGVPIVELAMNENRFGAPIFKQESAVSDVKQADAYMNFDSANVMSTSLVRNLNAATGGTRYKSGSIDINPATIDQLISGYLPGVATDIYRAADLGIRKSRGLDTKEAPLPVIDRLTAKIPEQWNAGAMRNAKEVVDTRFKELQAPDTTEARRKEILKEHPGIGNAKAVLQSTDQQIKTMRRNLEAIERDPANTDAKKVEARNYYKDLEKKVTARAVQATLKAGFKEELLGD